MEGSRDLKISVTIKGKEKKTRSKRERECKKGEKRKHTQEEHKYSLIAPLWLVEK